MPAMGPRAYTTSPPLLPASAPAPAPRAAGARFPGLAMGSCWLVVAADMGAAAAWLGLEMTFWLALVVLVVLACVVADAANSSAVAPSAVTAKDTTSTLPLPLVVACMKVCSSRNTPGSTSTLALNCVCVASDPSSVASCLSRHSIRSCWLSSGTVSFRRMRARWMGNFCCSMGSASSACCLAERFGSMLKCTSLSARSIMASV
mmetsp:Transcript_28737/g.73118  ORF Transcript_28737/g.73118 Transcript_28737/m.73118 type:complete len:204 (-) Transcript_28737:550-1161(-)